MTSRRHFLKAAAVLSGMWLSGCGGSGSGSSSVDNTTTWRMPDESETHLRTWMAFGAQESIWGDTLLPEVRRNLATIANSIAKFEPVSMLVREEDLALASSLVGSNVSLVVAALDDLWMRDTGPVFVKSNDGTKAAVNFNFNGWGNKQAHSLDATVADFVAKTANVSVKKTSLVLEGGGIEVDGQGTAIITESCVLNANRNPNVTKAQCETELKRLLGLEKIIWLPGIKGKDITDGHTDFYARFASPGVVLAGYDSDPASFDHAVTKQHLEILRAATDAKGRPLQVLVMNAPTMTRPTYASDSFAAGYINFYVCNGGVIAPQFGDTAADMAAKQVLQQAFPNHQIVQINIDGIAAGGGGIHCTTQQEPV